MSDNKRVKPQLPKCLEHPEAQPGRKEVMPGMHGFFCRECGDLLGYACMSRNSGDFCNYLRHTTATHQDLGGRSWVDSVMDAQG